MEPMEPMEEKRSIRRRDGRWFGEGRPLNVPYPPSGDVRYHGGVTLAGQVNVFVIWYGAWTTKQKQPIIDFLNGVSSHPAWGILSQYGSPSGWVGSIGYAGGYDDPAYAFEYLNNDNMTAVEGAVASLIAAGKVPELSNAVYVVLEDLVSTMAFRCAVPYCGTHSAVTLPDSNHVGVISIGWPASPTCNGGCLNPIFVTGAPPPNGDANIDSIISTLFNEIVGAVTNFDGVGWILDDKTVNSFLRNFGFAI
ncbi:hypothetical protein HK101_004457 [Irineochytrium annulatum]|nr:hypothetical protein HK101_004457 [Irineochytrium annulatum]